MACSAASLRSAGVRAARGRGQVHHEGGGGPLHRPGRPALVERRWLDRQLSQPGLIGDLPAKREQSVGAGQPDAASDEASTLVLLGLQSLPDGRRCVGADYGGAVVEQRSHLSNVGGPKGATVAAPCLSCHRL